MDMQFYPTPKALSEKAFSMFMNKDITRMLEPSAGRGDLLDGDKYRCHNYGSNYPVDVIEIDSSHHPILKEKGFNVVGHNFEDFSSLSIYSHILMNPPFAYGCQHLLKAFSGIYHGEIVAIINAETLKNPFSAERKLLLSIIAKHGEVEFMQSAFMGEGVERETAVEIALVHLSKEGNASDLIGDILGNLRADEHKADRMGSPEDDQALMLPSGTVENAVMMFNSAIEACKQAHAARTRADYFKGWLGKSMAEFLSPDKKKESTNLPEAMRNSFAKEYLDIKDRAWTFILRNTEVEDKLSLSARKRLHADFEKIKALEFTAFNIYGFFQGLSESGWEIQKDMICETFDLFTRYAMDNTVFYMGWVSNSKHKTCGMRLKTTRFILPGFTNRGFSYIGYNEMKQLEDIDRTFAILDGKDKPTFGLEYIFRKNLKELENGERLDTTYFSVRYYPKRGTIHFFANRKDLVERLNRLVGQWRNWLPPKDQESSMPKEFWKQYDNAEKFSSEIHEKFNKSAGRSYIRISDMLYSTAPGSDGERAAKALNDAVTSTLQGHGYNLDTMLECVQKNDSIGVNLVESNEVSFNAQLPLLLAA